MTEDLKPCPFCGGEARLASDYDDFDAYIECRQCGGRVRGANKDSIGTENMQAVKEAAITAWDMRADTHPKGKWLLYEDKDTNAWECSICHSVWQLIEGTPAENGMNYCHSCGAEMTTQTRRPRVRPSKDEYYLNIADAVLARSTCLRRHYGAVIVKDDEIIATGYNGSPRGTINCCDVGYCERETKGIPHGERYEACMSTHAEANAIISASRRNMIGATLYLAGQEADGTPIPDVKPCYMCYRLIINAGITTIITREGRKEVNTHE